MTLVDVAAMPVAEKLKLMEVLWESLCVNAPAQSSVPDWHSEVIDDRLARLEQGSEPVAPWSDAKERIRRQCKAG